MEEKKKNNSILDEVKKNNLEGFCLENKKELVVGSDNLAGIKKAEIKSEILKKAYDDIDKIIKRECVEKEIEKSVLFGSDVALNSIRGNFGLQELTVKNSPFFKKNKYVRGLVDKLGNMRAIDIMNKINSFLNEGDKVLDIGSGTGNVCDVLAKSGYMPTPLDVQDLSVVERMRPIVYNGGKMPFDNDSFDVSLVCTVLHHAPKPEEILVEAKRVSKKIIVVEDIYSNWFHKYSTYFFDSLANLEFIGHPHSNKNDKQWKETFEKLGLKLKEANYSSSFLVFSHAAYYLEK